MEKIFLLKLRNNDVNMSNIYIILQRKHDIIWVISKFKATISKNDATKIGKLTKRAYFRDFQI